MSGGQKSPLMEAIAFQNGSHSPKNQSRSRTFSMGKQTAIYNRKYSIKATDYFKGSVMVGLRMELSKLLNRFVES